MRLEQRERGRLGERKGDQRVLWVWNIRHFIFMIFKDNDYNFNDITMDGNEMVDKGWKSSLLVDQSSNT